MLPMATAASGCPGVPGCQPVTMKTLCVALFQILMAGGAVEARIRRVRVWPTGMTGGAGEVETIVNGALKVLGGDDETGWVLHSLEKGFHGMAGQTALVIGLGFQ